MAVKNIISLTHLEGARRLDAEYYDPKYFYILNKLTSKNSIPVKKVATPVKIKFNPTVVEYFDYIEISNIDLNTGEYITNRIIGKEAPSRAQWIVKNHNIIVSTVRPIRNAVALINENKENLVCSSGFCVLRSNEISPLYIFTYFKINSIAQLLDRYTTATQYPAISWNDILNIPIYLGSELFRELISDIVQRFILSLNESKVLYTQAEQLLLSELGLQDWKPARALTFVRSYSQVAKAGRMDAEYYHPKFQEMLDRIPLQVKFDRLGRLTTYKKGIEVGSEAYTDMGIPFWRVSNLSKHGLDESNVNFISHELYESLRKNYEPQQGEILLSKDATPGIAYYLEHPIQGIISSGILRLTIVDTIPPHYLELVLNSLFVQMQIEQDAGGSIIKHWKPSEVRKTLIPRLPDDKEKEIAQLVEKSHAARREAKALLEKAKRAVEIAIEEDEDKAKGYLELSMEG